MKNKTTRNLIGCTLGLIGIIGTVFGTPQYKCYEQQQIYWEGCDVSLEECDGKQCVYRVFDEPRDICIYTGNPSDDCDIVTTYGDPLRYEQYNSSCYIFSIIYVGDWCFCAAPGPEDEPDKIDYIWQKCG